jgi:hypothetical protein
MMEEYQRDKEELKKRDNLRELISRTYQVIFRLMTEKFHSLKLPPRFKTGIH